MTAVACHLRQFVRVGGLELGDFPVVEKDFRERVIEREFLEHVLVGRGRARRRLLDDGHSFFLEENLGDLLRRTKVEGLAGLLVSLAFELEHLLPQLVAHRLELRRVDQDPVPLHPEKDFARGKLDRAVDVEELFCGLQFRIERMVDPEREIGVLGSVGRGPRDIDLLEGNAPDAGALHLVVSEGFQSEMTGSEAVHVVARVALQHVGLEQRVVRDAPQDNAVVGKHVLVVLDVLAELLALFVLEPGFQHRKRPLDAQLARRAGVVVRERQVGGGARIHAEGHAHEPRLHRVQARRLGVEGNELGRFEHLEPASEIGFLDEHFVVALLAVRADGRGGSLRRRGLLRVARRLLRPGLES